MLFLPIVVASNFIGNLMFFNCLNELCFSISSAYLASFLSTHILATTLLWYCQQHNIATMFVLFAPSAPYMHYSRPGSGDAPFPFLTLIVLHWLPLYLLIMVTPLVGKLWVYLLNGCNCEGKLSIVSQRWLYLLGGSILAFLMVHASTWLIHPELL